MQFRGTTPADVALYCEKTGYLAGDDFKGVVCEDNGRVLGVVGYDTWTPNAVSMHVWLDNMKAISGRAFLREVFDYPFRHGRTLVVATTPADNTACLAFTKWIGFKELFRIPDGWDKGVDMVVKAMHKSDCIWLKPLRK